MIHRTNNLVTLLVCFSFSLLNTGLLNSVHAEQKKSEQEQKLGINTLYGKVTEILNVSGYTYVEIDTGKKKAWAAGPVTALKVGQMIAFSTRFPMENFRSIEIKRVFPVLYFVSGFVSDDGVSANKDEATTSMHSQISKKPAERVIKEVNKVKGGNTIAEIYANKKGLEGKTVRLRGQVTKFTAGVMGKNWVHVWDPSSKEDLTATTDSMVAIDDVVIIEGKLELDKDFGYGYVYPIILQDAKVTKE